MTPRSLPAVLGILSAVTTTGCKKRDLPSDMVGSYTRSGDLPAELRAELSIARGGMVLTVVRVVSARTFRSLSCDGSSCQFELAADGAMQACSGSFDKVQNTIVVVASGACQPYSGRWVLLDGPPAASPVEVRDGAAPPASPDAGPTTTTLDFPPDIPAPRDHMSCLSACSIVDTRCHRTSATADQTAFLGCVEKGQICRARCEQVFPFFGDK
jgi:hypothetical protein